MTATPDSIPTTPAPPRPAPAAPKQRFRAVRVIIALFIREMSTTYGRNAMGYLWAILEPVAGIMLLTYIFSLALRSPALGTNFALFFATGLLPFQSYMDVSNKISGALKFSKQLLFYPRVTYLDALLARFLLNAMTNLLIFVLLITALINLYDIQVFLDIPIVASGLAMGLALAAGIGVLNCYLKSQFPVWDRIWAVVTRPLFFISGIFFMYEDIPQPYQGWIWWNPLLHVTGQVRRGVYATYDGSYVSPTYVLTIAGVSLLAGLVLLRRYYRDIINF